MDKRVQDRIEEKLQNGFQLKAGQVVEKAGDIFKGIAGYAILAVLIYFITLWILTVIFKEIASLTTLHLMNTLTDINTF